MAVVDLGKCGDRRFDVGDQVDDQWDEIAPFRELAELFACRRNGMMECRANGTESCITLGLCQSAEFAVAELGRCAIISTAQDAGVAQW